MPNRSIRIVVKLVVTAALLIGAWFALTPNRGARALSFVGSGTIINSETRVAGFCTSYWARIACDPKVVRQFIKSPKFSGGTRSLTARFTAAWSARHPGAEVISRDIGLNPVPPINESWIAAAFASPVERTPAMHQALTISEALIDEIFSATAIVIGTPMYNFGMPAQFKAYVDQIVRVGRTFSFGDGNSAEPYQSLVPSKPVLIFTSTGASGYEPGGHSAQFNFLDPHLKAIFHFIGLTDISFVRVSDEEQRRAIQTNNGRR